MSFIILREISLNFIITLIISSFNKEGDYPVFCVFLITSVGYFFHMKPPTFSDFAKKSCLLILRLSSSSSKNFSFDFCRSRPEKFSCSLVDAENIK